jgi:hypothetical protein
MLRDLTVAESGLLPDQHEALLLSEQEERSIEADLL